MSKFVAKFRKDRDYNDDNEYSQKRKRSAKGDPTKKLAKYNLDAMIYEDEDYFHGKSSQKKLRQYS